ncbi:MAG: cation:proton antiporter [Thioalkalispiraceae bacterium]
MSATSQFLLTLGGVLLLGLLTSELGRRTFLPRVTLLLIFGALIGPEALDIIPDVFSERFDIIANMALLMVGFLLGGKLTRDSFDHSVKKILWISITAAVFTTLIVSLSLFWAGVSLGIAILLGCIAAATDSAAILDVTIEQNYRGPFKTILLSIVALDDAWALILFSFGIAIVTKLNGASQESASILIALREIGGSILLGLVIGFPAAYLTGRVKQGQPILTEALGLVFLCGGLAAWLDLSFLIASMVMGMIITNFAKHHDYPFHAIENIEWPVMVVFFVLAGASLDFSALYDIGLIGLIFLISRAIGKYVGALLGSELSHTESKTRQWIGIALLPQAGVAIGMALVASNQFPEYRQMLLSITISSTVIFEIIGPVFTRLALQKTSTQDK